MDAIDSNVRNYLHLPDHPNCWQNFQGNRAVFASVQRAIVIKIDLAGASSYQASFLKDGSWPNSSTKKYRGTTPPAS